MAFEAYEQLQTRSYAVSNGLTTGSRVFVVFDAATPITTPQTVIDNFGGGLIPRRGDFFPDSLVLYAKQYRIEKRAGTDMWELTWEYTSTPPSDKDPMEIGYVEVTLDFSAEFDDRYRLLPSLPTYGTPTTQFDIGGERMDIVGSPLSSLRYKAEMTVTETVDYATYTSIINPAILVAMGRRNRNVFQGAPIGRALYKGASVRRIGMELFSISHSMQIDSDLHLIQVPLKNANGEVDCKTFSKPYTQAITVLWNQPFPEFVNFSGISPNWS